MNNTYFLWIDLETTGFYPYEGKILEVAAILTPSDFLKTGEPYAEYQSVVKFDAKELKKVQGILSMNGVVLQMHTKNGLLKEIEAGNGKTIEEIEADLIKKVSSLPPNSIIHLAGNSIHFDREWIKAHMIWLDKHLSYRILDVRSLQIAFPELDPKLQTKGHRAMDDLRESIATYKAIREQVMMSIEMDVGI